MEVTKGRMVTAASYTLTVENALAAHDAWGFNCGPAALCAVLGLTPDQVRLHLGDFERKRFMNPSLMRQSLFRLGVLGIRVKYERLRRFAKTQPVCPRLGVVRVQWCGPWTEPGVPPAASYRHTHWIGARVRDGKPEAFDINALDHGPGGWMSADDWKRNVAPAITASIPRASGEWWLTHCWDLILPGDS